MREGFKEDDYYRKELIGYAVVDFSFFHRFVNIYCEIALSNLRSGCG